MELKKEIESLLFSSGKVMAIEDLAELTQKTKKDVLTALESLKQDYDERDTSLMIVKRGDGWKLNVREKYVNLVTKIVADTELPFPVLETLAVIAYKSPKAMQAEVIKARGTNAYEHISELIESGFIERKKQGRSFVMFLTNKFFEYFDVEGDKDIKEYLKEVRPAESSRHIQKKLGQLDVIDVPEDENEKQRQDKPGESGEDEGQHKLGSLEIVDSMPEKQGTESSVDSMEADDRITADDVQPDNDFLREMEKKIDALSRKNDEFDQDESFRRQGNDDIFGSEEGSESPEQEEEAEEARSEDEDGESGEEKQRGSSEEDNKEGIL